MEDALRIFETANQAQTDNGSSQLAILIDEAGGLRVVESEGWHPEALQHHYGARTVYQITRRPGAVKVAGRSGGQSCFLETASPASPCQPVFPVWNPPFSHKLVSGDYLQTLEPVERRGRLIPIEC